MAENGVGNVGNVCARVPNVSSISIRPYPIVRKTIMILMHTYLSPLVPGRGGYGNLSGVSLFAACSVQRAGSGRIVPTVLYSVHCTRGAGKIYQPLLVVAAPPAAPAGHCGTARPL